MRLLEKLHHPHNTASMFCPVFAMVSTSAPCSFLSKTDAFSTLTYRLCSQSVFASMRNITTSGCDFISPLAPSFTTLSDFTPCPWHKQRTLLIFPDRMTARAPWAVPALSVSPYIYCIPNSATELAASARLGPSLMGTRRSQWRYHSGRTVLWGIASRGRIFQLLTGQ